MRAMMIGGVVLGAFAGCDELDELDELDVHINGSRVVINTDKERRRAHNHETPVALTGFDAVSTETFVDVVASPAPEHSAHMHCAAKVADRLELLLDGTVLVVRKKAGAPSGGRRGGCELHVTAPNWRALVSLGSGDITATGPLTALEHVHAKGSGDITISGIQYMETLTVSTAGSGDITLQGTALGLVASTAGSGDIEARNLATKTATVTTLGSGDVTLTASDTVTATTRGSGDIDVNGGATVTGTSTGSGDISR